MSEENGAIIVPVSYANFGSRHSSYTSHTSRITYTSHADLFKPPMTKERQLRSRSARNYFNPSEHRYYRDVSWRPHGTDWRAVSSPRRVLAIARCGNSLPSVGRVRGATLRYVCDLKCAGGFQDDFDSSSVSKSKQQVDECGGYNDSQKHTVVDMRGENGKSMNNVRGVTSLNSILRVLRHDKRTLLQTWWCWTTSSNRRPDVRAEAAKKQVRPWPRSVHTNPGRCCNVSR